MISMYWSHQWAKKGYNTSFFEVKHNLCVICDITVMPVEELWHIIVLGGLKGK